MSKTTAQHKENFVLNLAINIFLPVLILQKLSAKFGPLNTLILALLLPLAYGGYIYLRTKQKSWMSALGLVSVLLTGGLALLELSGFWFVMKEGAFPLLLGLGVFITAFGSKPFMKTLFLQPQMLNIERISQKVSELNRQQALQQLLKSSTLLFSSSFFLSSLLNFWLASRIFIDLNPNLSELERKNVLNQQIADMTWQSQIVIVVPLMIFSVFVLIYFLRKLSQLTNLKFEELLPDDKNQNKI